MTEPDVDINATMKEDEDEKVKEMTETDVDINAAMKEDEDEKVKAIAPQCPGCQSTMQWSAYAVGMYEGGWCCSNVSTCGQCTTNAGEYRWFCLECSNDLCSKCHPHHQELHAESHIQRVNVDRLSTMLSPGQLARLRFVSPPVEEHPPLLPNFPSISRRSSTPSTVLRQALQMSVEDALQKEKQFKEELAAERALADQRIEKLFTELRASSTDEAETKNAVLLEEAARAKDEKMLAETEKKLAEQKAQEMEQRAKKKEEVLLKRSKKALLEKQKANKELMQERQEAAEEAARAKALLEESEAKNALLQEMAKKWEQCQNAAQEVRSIFQQTSANQDGGLNSEDVILLRENLLKGINDIFGRMDPVAEEMEDEKKEVAPQCPGCLSTMQWSDYAAVHYEDGWECTNFSTCGQSGTVGECRWFCQVCLEDICGKCHPHHEDVASTNDDVNETMKKDEDEKVKAHYLRDRLAQSLLESTGALIRAMTLKVAICRRYDAKFLASKNNVVLSAFAETFQDYIVSEQLNSSLMNVSTKRKKRPLPPTRRPPQDSGTFASNAEELLYSLPEEVVGHYGEHSEQNEARIDGLWRRDGQVMAFISGKTLMWPDGRKAPISKDISGTKFSMDWEGERLMAELQSDGMLHWRDGDAWQYEEVRGYYAGSEDEFMGPWFEITTAAAEVEQRPVQPPRAPLPMFRPVLKAPSLPRSSSGQSSFFRGDEDRQFGRGKGSGGKGTKGKTSGSKGGRSWEQPGFAGSSLGGTQSADLDTMQEKTASIYEIYEDERKASVFKGSIAKAEVIPFNTQAINHRHFNGCKKREQVKKKESKIIEREAIVTDHPIAHCAKDEISLYYSSGRAPSYTPASLAPPYMPEAELTFLQPMLFGPEQDLSVANTKQLCAALLPRMLCHSTTRDTVIGGISLGGVIAFDVARLMECCTTGVRGVFELDIRSCPPLVMSRFTKMMSPGECPRTRLVANSAHFITTLGEMHKATSGVDGRESEHIQDDQQASSGRALHTESVEVYFLNCKNHASLGNKGAWDIFKYLKPMCTP